MITVCIKKILRIFRYVLWSGTMFPWRRRRRRLHPMMATFIYLMIPTFIYRCVHLSERSSYLLMTTFISRCVHLSPDDDVPLTERLSLHDAYVPIWDRHVERVVPINGYIWTEALNGSAFFCLLLSLLRFAVGFALLAAVLFLARPGALLLLLMFFELGFQEDSLRKHKN